MSSDPERFFVDRSECEREIGEIASSLEPRAAEAARRAPDSKFTTGTLVRKGRSVPVERRGGRFAQKAEARSQKSEELRGVFK